MKKILLGTTAIVAAGMIASPSADAAEKLQVSVGGYMEQWFGYVSQDEQNGTTNDYSGFDVKSDSEIHFTGMTTLDNGISVGINVQLEANTNTGDQIDESYLIVKGNFGEINLGSENSALYKMNYAPDEYGIGINSGDQGDWVTKPSGFPSFFRSPFGSTNVEPAATNDSEKLTYYTPRIEGFQLGVSYIPDSNQDNNAQPDRNASGSFYDGYAFGANFKRDLGGFDLGVSGGYGAFTEGAGNNQDDPAAWSLGLTVGFGGFSAGASYANSEGVTDATDQEGYNLGVAYASGPWGVSLGWYHGEQEGASNNVGSAEQNTYALSGKYALGPGVTAAATLGHTEYESDAAGFQSTDGTYFVVGMKLSF